MSIYARINNNKKAIDEIRPFDGYLLKQLQDYYRIGLTWSSNALEGNTLTITETKVLLEDGLTVGGKPLRDTFEALGHAQAYDFMFGLVHQRQISVKDIKTMHRMFYKSIDEENAGEWRKQQVIVTGTEYQFPAHHELESRMAELEGWINSDRDKFHPVEFSSLLHLKFVSIHPFIDGNGRVSRLLMNLALIQDGYMPAIVPPVCRTDYLNAIRIYQNQNNSEPFCGFIAGQELESQKEIMRLLHVPQPPKQIIDDMDMQQ